MEKTFVETRNFTERFGEYLDDDGYAALQQALLDNPDKGAVMQGCCGLRKLRVADSRRQKGKRGGARVIYVHVSEVNWIILLDIYGKHEKDDLSADEKRSLKKLVQELRQEAIARAQRSSKRGNDE